MKAEELKTQSVDELNATLINLLKDHLTLRMKHKGAELSDTSSLGKVKKQIARVKTIIKEKS